MLEYFSRWLRRYQGVEANPLYRLAVEVATRRTSMERALESAQTFNVIGRLADGDLLELDQQVEFEARTNVDFALVLGRLNAAAARAKGFERVLVDLGEVGLEAPSANPHILKYRAELPEGQAYR